MNIRRKKIALDLVPFKPGIGGAGGGISTLIENVISYLDANDSKSYDLICFSTTHLNLKNIRTVVIPFDCSSYLRRLAWIHLLLPWVCLRYRVDLLHKFAFEMPVLPFCRVVVHIHDFMAAYYIENSKALGNPIKYSDMLRLHYFNFISGYSLRFARVAYFLTSAVAKEALQRHPSSKATPVVTYAGAGVTFTESSLIRNEGKQIICVAGFFPHKNHFCVIESFERLLANHQDYSDLKLIFRGNVPDQCFFEKIINRIEMSPNRSQISIALYETKLATHDIYKNAALSILLSGYEGLGLPIIESQACGVPVICSDIPVFREIAGDSVMYVNREDPSIVAETMHLLLSDQDAHSNIIESGMKNASRFSWEKTAQQIRSGYMLALR